MTRDKNSISSTIIWISLKVIINLMLLFLLVEGFTASYYFTYRLFADHPYMAVSSQVQTVTIEPGNGADEIAAMLEERRIVDDRYLFLARVYIGRYNSRILAGTYSLGPGMSPDEICRIICGMQGEEET